MGSASLVSGDFVEAGHYSEQAAAMAAELNEPTLQGIAAPPRVRLFAGSNMVWRTPPQQRH